MTVAVVYRVLDSPIGPLTLAGTGAGLTHLLMSDQTHAPDRAGWRRDDSRFDDAATQLVEYFAGDRRDFDIELDMVGTPFQRRVWEALRAIPYGQTRSYGEIATQIGAPGASRAVGLANGRNPISVIVPCHRVIGANGNLTGYGGGLERKRALLALERRTAPAGPTLFDVEGAQSSGLRGDPSAAEQSGRHRDRVDEVPPRVREEATRPATLR